MIKLTPQTLKYMGKSNAVKESEDPYGRGRTNNPPESENRTRDQVLLYYAGLLNQDAPALWGLLKKLDAMMEGLQKFDYMENSDSDTTTAKVNKLVNGEIRKMLVAFDGAKESIVSTIEVIQEQHDIWRSKKK